MRGKDLLEKMAYIRPDMIEEAERAPKKHFFIGPICAAASVLVVGAIGLISLNGGISPQPNVTESQPSVTESQPGITESQPSATEPQPSTTEPQPEKDYSNLPIISPSEVIGACGFEGYNVYDISELVGQSYLDGKPTPETLPVFKNHYAEADVEQMKQEILEAAENLGLDTETLEITDDAPNEAAIEKMKEAFGGGEIPPEYLLPSMVEAEQGRYRITYTIGGTLDVKLTEPEQMPDGLCCKPYESTPEQLIKAGEYLADKYADLLGMENPTVYLEDGHYNFYGEQKYNIRVFDDSGSEEERMLNCTFRYISFRFDDNGDLFIIRFNKSDLSDCIGDYPIISQQQALGLLDEGRYISTLFHTPSSDRVERAVLTYRTGQKSEYFLPYYKFFIDVTDDEQIVGLPEGLRIYGTYYVPAVDPAFLDQMTVWNGSFNSGQ